MKLKVLVVFVIFLCYNSVNVFAGKKINLLIEVPDNINADKIQVYMNDGIELRYVRQVFLNNKSKVTEEVDALYASVNIVYPGYDGVLYGAWILVKPDAPSIISFKKVDSSTVNKLSSYTLNNGIDVLKCKQYSKLKSFCKILLDSNNYYSNQYRKLKNDSILNLYNLSSVKLALQQMNFIKYHGGEYFYFWFFRANVAGALLKTNQMEVYDVFNTAFPKKFKESNEGRHIKELIEGNIFIKKGNKSPVFTVKDSEGRIISSKNFKGKFILLNFWATWCSPCVQEIPFLKKIRNTYSEDKLIMISVSCDKDSSVYFKGLKKYGLNWINVFNNTEISNLFGNKPIPATYLIDKSGTIQFSSWEESLSALEKFLNANLLNKP
jgi:thiol-disulfide isomerase/thioredoxin